MEIDNESIKQFCPNNEAVIYGFYHCSYGIVRDLLENKGVKAGNHCGLKDRKIYEIKDSDSCKSMLVNTILENHASLLNEKPIIPIIFCIDTSNNKFSITAKNILDKNQKSYKLVTHTELRRAYKLCYDPYIHPALREVAKKSFHFVKVEKINNTEIQLKALKAPWEAPDWDAYWAARKNQTKTTFQPKRYNWRLQANDFVSKMPSKATT